MVLKMVTHLGTMTETYSEMPMVILMGMCLDLSKVQN